MSAAGDGGPGRARTDQEGGAETEGVVLRQGPLAHREGEQRYPGLFHQLFNGSDRSREPNAATGDDNRVLGLCDKRGGLLDCGRVPHRTKRHRGIEELYAVGRAGRREDVNWELEERGPGARGKRGLEGHIDQLGYAVDVRGGLGPLGDRGHHVSLLDLLEVEPLVHPQTDPAR